uniref:Uncharacterized protein n=1 Tax=Acrobeloides nanus TaxID=290746 RepID=A0A914DMU8_9BILA
MANIKVFIVVLILRSVAGDIIKESMLNLDEKHTYTLDLVWLKELWHRAGVMALIKAKAKSILKSDSDISLHERLVYRHCEKEALTPVALAKCIVSLMNARDRALSPVNGQTNDAITFWDVFMPWKKLTNFKEFVKTVQTTTSSPDSPNYDLIPLKRPSFAPPPFIKERPRLKIFMKKSMKRVYITKPNQRRIYATRIKSEGMSKYPTNVYSSQPKPSYGYPNQRMPSYIYPSSSMPSYKKGIDEQSIRSYSSPSKSVPSYSTRFAKYRLKDIDNYGPSAYFQPQRSPLITIPKYSHYQTRQKRDVQKKSILSNGPTNKLPSIEKLRTLKEYTQMQQHAQAFSKKMNSENSKFLRKKGFPFVYETEKPRKLNLAEDVIDLVNGYLRKANMVFG